ncbi:hypothetical protein CEUSTIGMA_g278.t1 [Chlamydomonas eustigma]|uniref:RING-type domain-containing protein n=1 Tax=Chlamydomonas eustigma TaxID=1157962 RepID=A0A250WPS7_9CHLO|nr:hypothetical protein CEUSTIGMA_g278.t1 [Chlamydomonas eustigma]|eukprot:GAX72823.1 hypothetical protein CEUSTIGMA_g278.t1 [Chlamydomonas eustigma]
MDETFGRSRLSVSAMVNVKSVVDDDHTLAKLLQQQEMVFYNLSNRDMNANESCEESQVETDEALARRMQEQEDAFAGTQYADINDQLGEAPDLELLAYEELQALGDAVGIVPKALPPHIVTCIPIQRYEDVPHTPTNMDRCCICQADFELSEELMILPCSHFFHRNCLSQWFHSSKSCPYCSKEVCVNHA